MIVFAQFFQIKEVIILGNQKISTQDINNILTEKIKLNLIFFETKSIFLVNLKEMNKKILEKFPDISEAKVERVLPSTLIAEIKERSPAGIWHQRDEYFYFDNKAVIFEKTEEKIEPVVICEVEKPIILGKPIIQKRNLDSILEINSKAKGSEIDIREFIISGDEKKLKVNISEGWYILFNLEEDTKEKLFNLDLVLKEKIPLERRRELEYIDLRFGNRVFFRYKGEGLTE